MPNPARARRTTYFNRAPRNWIVFPKETIKVPDPPLLPSLPPKPQMLMLMLPTFTMGLTAIGTVIYNLISGSKAWWLALLMLSGAVVTPIVQAWIYRSNKKAWEKQVGEIERGFKAEVDALQDQLGKLRDTQLERAVELNPPTDTLRDRACQRHRRLWERRPHDADFLHLRLGLHAGEPTYTIRFIESVQRDTRKQRVNDAAQIFTTVPNLPCTVDLPGAGSIGIAGEASFRAALARTLICNLAAHHSPGEVRLYAVYETGGGSASIGNWIRWLPHVRPTAPDQFQLASAPEAINRLMKQLLEELRRREQVLRIREKPEGETWPYLVILVENPDQVRGQEALHLVLRRGPELRAGAIFLAGDAQQLPGACGARVEANPQTGDGFVLTLDQPDAPVVSGAAELTTDPDVYETLARSLAPIQFASTSGGGELPGGITLSALFGATSARNLDLRRIWAEHADPARQLTAPIGMAIGNRLMELDLHNTMHGTHGLIAGTTGAGKTVLLSTVIAALAVANSPRLVNFVIIDMKGDPNLELLSRLPHTVGFASVQDRFFKLESYIQRAIVALRSEIDHRMQILGQAGVTDIFDYNRHHPRPPLPHLIVIIDEFAVLKKQAPELMEKLVDVSALGRAPGVHLILCTQSPSGVVSDKIWANSQFRICLRVANPEESRSMLHLPDAANLPVKPQGRAYLQAAGGEVEIFELFQVAYAGGRVGTAKSQDTVSTEFEIAKIWPDGMREVIYTHNPAVTPVVEEAGLPTELEYVTDLAHRTAIEEGIALPLPGPWLPPLPETIPLDSLLAQHPTYRKWADGKWSDPNSASRLKAPIGMMDAPAQQRQEPLLLDLARDQAHLWVCGTLGSGKVLTLQTLIMALAQTHTPAEAHFYLLAFGGAGLKPLAKLPHVGALIELKEIERLQRMLTMIEQEVASRNQIVSNAGVETVAAYRHATGEPLPTWIIVVEDLGKLVKEAVNSADFQDVLERLNKLLSFGVTCDIHFVFSTPTPVLYREMAGSVNGRLALRLPEGDYSQALGLRLTAKLDEIPGRGFWRARNDALECQIATLTNTGEGKQPAALLAAIADQMNQYWKEIGGARPKPVETLPTRLPLAWVLTPPSEAEWRTPPTQESLPVVVGWNDDLQLLTVDLISDGPSFLVVGAPQSGKTGLLETLALSLAIKYSPDTIWLYGIDFKHDRLSRTLSGLVNTRAAATTPTQAIALLDGLLKEIQDRAAQSKEVGRTGTGPLGARGSGGHWPRLFLFVDDFSRDMSRDNKENADLLLKIDQCFEQGAREGLHLIVAGDGAALSAAIQPFMQKLRAAQRGFLFVKASDNAHLLNVKVPRLPAKHMLPGRTFVVQPTSTPLAQLGFFDQNAPIENVEIKNWLSHLYKIAAAARAEAGAVSAESERSSA